MGNAKSSSESEGQPVNGSDDNTQTTNTMIEDDPFDGIETVGYRVLGVQPNSPASKAGLVSFLDFLIGCNDQMLLGSGTDLLPGMEYDDIDLPTLLNDNKNIQLEFLVFNIKSQEARIVQLTPSDTWGGAGLLGVTIRLDNYAGAEDRFIRVLSVVENSPASVSGLCQDGTDFVLGTTHHTINSLSHFAQLLHDNIDRIIELYVYNSDTDIVRVVTLMPSYEWNTKSGGSGLFGAEVGTGYLHRLPYKSRSTSGTCVERKVRYVPQSPSSSSPSTTNAAKAAKVVLLEDAPQMEMEAPDTEEEEDDENVEEVYNEPKREQNYVAPHVQEQVGGSGTAEDAPVNSHATTKLMSEEPTHQLVNNAVTGASSYQPPPPPHEQQPITQQQQQPQLEGTARPDTAAAVIFGQPLAAPPLMSHQQKHPPSQTTAATTTTLSPLGPPPPLSSYSTQTSLVAPPTVSYSQPPPPPTQQQQHQSYYYGGSQPATTTAGSFAYGPPATTMMMPPPPVGGVWNHSKSSQQ